MDNYRKHKKRGVRSTPVDGIVGPRKRPKQGTLRPSGGPTFNKTSDRPKLGNFKRPDGLHQIQQGRLGFEGRRHPAARQPARDHQGNIAVGSKPKKSKKPHRIRRIALRGALVAIALVMFTGGYLTIKAYIQSRKILAGGGGAAALEENVDPTRLNGEGDGRVNILLLGRGGKGHEAPDLTDTILVASIDPIQKEAALVSVPRDLYIRTPSSGSMKINAVYATAKNKVLNGQKIDNQEKQAEKAGFDAVEDAVEMVLGIPMHYHGMIDFSGFSDAVDAVGGVDVNAPSRVYEVMRINGRNYTLDVKPGQQHFDGFRALAYTRSRKTSTRGDFDRAERQRLILVGLKDKVLSVGTFANPLKINELLNALGNHIQTNFTQRELLRVYDIGKDIESSKIESIGLADPPNNYLKTGSAGGQSVVMPVAGLNEYKAIHNFIRNKLRDGFLRQEDASIAVYNGTGTTGLASRTAEDLKSYGYNITTVGDAPTKGYTNTVLVDLRNGQKKYTKHYLEKRLSTTATGSLPDGIEPGTADFVIILGSNEVQRLNQ